MNLKEKLPAFEPIDAADFRGEVDSNYSGERTEDIPFSAGGVLKPQKPAHRKYLSGEVESVEDANLKE